MEVHGVSKRFANGVQALDGVELQVAPGEVLVILGPSGAGKSTLLRTINGLEWPTTGRVTVDSLPVTPRNLRRVRTRVGMVFQQFNLVWRLSAMANVLCGRLAHRAPWQSLVYLFNAEDRRLAAEALQRVGLADRAWDRVDRLSGGQQQRIGIARALVQQPRVILADEPVASLDPATADAVLSLLVELGRASRIAVVINLHQVEAARRFADRIVGLRAGQVAFDGPPSQLTPAVLEALYGVAAPA